MAFSLLLLGKFSSKNPNFHYKISSFIRKTQSFFKPNDPKHFSSTSQPDPKTTLSARMSFVFDQIDAIEKERNNKDEALQRIRAWRETKKKKTEDEEVKEGSKFEGSEKNLGSEMERKRENLVKKEVELVHPWKEWIELMERLVQQNYFDHRRNEEEKLLEGLSIDVAAAGLPEERVDFDFTKDWMSVKTACLNFGRDRFDILRSLSRQDIQVLVGHGCPSVDKKVVFSAKLLRKHVHLDEGDVCSSCNMRSSCDRAYLVTLKEDEARTLDIMRVLLTYGFDPMNGSVENKSLLKMKSVKTVIRKLLHEVVKLSAVPIDPNLPPPVFKKPPPKVKQPPPPPKRRVGRDDVEMKKGDWLCPKCDFMNFAKNTVCLQCDAKRPKRQLLPGEWECPECNFLNYRRNMACFHCDHKRPNDEFMENQMHIREDGPRERGPRTRLEKVASAMPEVSNAWNFDFDDNESDGADVAAFEYADPPKVSDNSFGENNSQEGNFRGFEHDDSLEKGRTSMNSGRGKYSDLSQRKSGTGFDDFDDEEEDDVDSYELETSDNNSMQRASTRNFSDVEEYSESEDFDAADLDSVTRRGTNKSSRNNSPGSTRETFSGSEDDGKDLNSDEGLSVYSNWKSSRIGEPRSKVRGQGRNSPYRGMNFDSDNKLETDSGSDDDGEMHHGRGSKQKGRDSWSSNRRDFRRGQCSDSEDGLAFGSESDDDNLPFSRNKTRGNKAGPGRGGNTFRGHSQFESTRGGAFRHNGRTNDKRNSSDNADWGRSIRGSHTGQRGPREDGYGEDRMNSRRGSSGRGRQDGFRHNNRTNERRENSFGDSDRGKSYQGSRTNGREFARDDYGRGRMNGRRGNARDFRGAGRDERFGYQQRERSNGFKDNRDGGFGYQQRERSNGFKDNRDGDFGDDRPRRRIIER